MASTASAVRRSPLPDVQIFERVYPFAWLGILANAPPSSDELVYSLHERGFALFSMRSHEVTRLYLQCAPDEPFSSDGPMSGSGRSCANGWNDRRMASRTKARFFKKASPACAASSRSRLRHGRLFLAGDAAHIVPPTGAKGLNLAMADVSLLASAFDRFFTHGDDSALETYSARALQRAWRAQRFSWWMTSMLHRSDSDNPFDHRRQLAELEYVVSSDAAMTSLAENYAGFPFDPIEN